MLFTDISMIGRPRPVPPALTFWQTSTRANGWKVGQATDLARRSIMSLGTILLIVLILLLIGALPTWPYSSGWGYYPSGGIGLVLVIIVILLLMGRI